MQLRLNTPLMCCCGQSPLRSCSASRQRAAACSGAASTSWYPPASSASSAQAVLTAWERSPSSWLYTCARGTGWQYNMFSTCLCSPRMMKTREHRRLTHVPAIHHSARLVLARQIALAPAAVGALLVQQEGAGGGGGPGAARRCLAHRRQRLEPKPGGIGEADAPVAVPAAVGALDAAADDVGEMSV